MLENRKTKRARLAYYLEVFDEKTQKMIGHLINITPEGLMLETHQPIEAKKIFRLRMQLPATIFRKTQILFEARSVWCRQDSPDEQYKAGFQLQNMDSKVEKAINRLIEKFK